jgi:RNA polymerase sigma factor (sigma-70 family)
MFRRRRRRIRFADHEVAEVALENWPAQTASPEVFVDLRTLHGVLEGLEGESRNALLLRRVEGLTLDEIAERMDLSVATVKRRLDVAKVFLGRIELELSP